MEKTSGSTTTALVFGTNNQVLEDEEFAYTYDNEGNRVAKFRKVPTSSQDDFTYNAYDHP